MMDRRFPPPWSVEEGEKSLSTVALSCAHAHARRVGVPRIIT
jgi:hypothetical protein